MKFKEKLEEMLNSIEFKESESKVFRCRFSGREYFNRENYFNLILEYLFEQDFIFSEENERSIFMTLSEIILNSQVYGCQEKDILYVAVSAYCGSKGIVFHIKDEGNGFDYKNKLGERRMELDKYDRYKFLFSKESLTKSGQGLFCLLTFPDDFKYNRRGNEIFIKFNLKK